MKIFNIFFLFLFVFSGVFILNAQENKVYKTYPDLKITGNENPDLSNAEVIELQYTPVFEPVVAGELVFEIHNITNRATGYDLQSNASTQQVWADPNTDNVHAIFTNSQESAGWSDRTCLYYGSDDGGLSWLELGPVPTTSRAGFPSVYGTSTGAGVPMDHNGFFGGFTRTTVFIDNSPFEYNFTAYDPGDIGDGPVWPRHTVDQNDNVIFASSGAPDAILHVNTLDPTIPAFSGYQDFPLGEDGEQYDFSISPSGKIGFVYNGLAPNDGDVYYHESTDGGLTWTDAFKIFDRDDMQDTTMGAIRGVQCNFNGEEPCVTYEICMQIFSSGNFFPGLPSEIHFWSPAVNGGVPMVIADSSNVPFYPYVGTNDVHVPVCRPVIGSSFYGYLFIAFNATTENVFPSADTTSYMAGYFTYSFNGGNTWSDPEKFTPDSPLRDWRYPSINEYMPYEHSRIDIVMQGDTIPGSTVNAAGMPVGVTAQYFHFRTDILLPSVDDDNSVVNSFSLEQNYPNPFNPSTKIKYSIPNAGLVTLKVYDVLGNEVATLVNNEQNIGTYELDFKAAHFSSGVYFYTLKSQNFVQTKKLILLK